MSEDVRRVAAEAKARVPITGSSLLDGIQTETTQHGVVAIVRYTNPWSPNPALWPEHMVLAAARWNPNIRRVWLA